MISLPSLPLSALSAKYFTIDQRTRKLLGQCEKEERVDAAAAIKFHPEHTHHIIDLGHTWCYNRDEEGSQI